MKTFKQQLKKLRTLTGLSQTQFVEQYLKPLPLKTYQAWEQGYRKPSQAVRCMVFQTLHAKNLELWKGEFSPPQTKSE